jgi:hypothetical protein
VAHEGARRDDDRIDLSRSPETIVIEFLSLLLVIVGFAFLFIAAAKLGAGPQDAFDALFTSPMPPARPRGMQENDLPRFAI